MATNNHTFIPTDDPDQDSNHFNQQQSKRTKQYRNKMRHACLLRPNEHGRWYDKFPASPTLSETRYIISKIFLVLDDILKSLSQADYGKLLLLLCFAPILTKTMTIFSFFTHGNSAEASFEDQGANSSTYLGMLAYLPKLKLKSSARQGKLVFRAVGQPTTRRAGHSLPRNYICLYSIQDVLKCPDTLLSVPENFLEQQSLTRALIIRKQLERIHRYITQIRGRCGVV
ncbi:hypothetical protein K449DRAFT_436451 [Hypoxylon sp. EC38]|nr:hypothetical protein K449DRAFT_436451 [Hypoxylon sp. EC38]